LKEVHHWPHLSLPLTPSLLLALPCYHLRPCHHSSPPLLAPLT
jgi:hypothetical protein